MCPNSLRLWSSQVHNWTVMVNEAHSVYGPIIQFCVTTKNVETLSRVEMLGVTHKDRTLFKISKDILEAEFINGVDPIRILLEEVFKGKAFLAINAEIPTT